jgi:hypothetical protein
MRLWYSRLAGTTANQMLLVALGWQMYDLTGSAWDLGLVGLLQFLPALALVLVAGQVIDRLHRARIAVCMAAQTLVAALLIWGSASHSVSREMLFVVSLAVGTVRAFQLPTQQALTPMVLPPSLLPRGLAFSSAGAQGAIVAGPAIGGFLYAAGPATVYATCAFLFVLAGVLVFGVRYEQAARVKKAISLETLLAGVRFVRDRPVVLGAISLDLFAVLFGGAVALLPIFARDILHVGAWAWASCAPRPPRRLRHLDPAHPLAGDAPRRPGAAFGGGGVRRRHLGVRPLDLVRALARRARRHRRGRHDQRRHPPVAGAARHARRHARPGERRQLGLHRRLEPARRVRVGRHRRLARPGGLGRPRRHRHAARRRRLGAVFPAWRNATG